MYPDLAVRRQMGTMLQRVPTAATSLSMVTVQVREFQIFFFCCMFPLMVEVSSDFAPFCGSLAAFQGSFQN